MAISKALRCTHAAWRARPNARWCWNAQASSAPIWPPTTRSRGKVTPLHGDFEAANPPDTLYLHDMAVLPALAGQGLAAKALLAPLWRGAVARGLTRSALVAVQGSQGYWERHGYAVHTLRDAVQRQRLAAYGEGAVYMRCARWADQRVIGSATPMAAKAPPQTRLKRLP